MHRDLSQIEHDQRREAWLKARGVQVLRIPSREVEDYPDQVAQRVLRLAEKMSSTS